MRRPISLTLRINTFFGISALIVFFGFGWFIENSIKQHFDKGDAEELEDIAHSVTQAMRSHKTEIDDSHLIQRLRDFLVGHHGVILEVIGSDNRVFFRSDHSVDLSQFSAHPPDHDHMSTLFWSNSDNTYRILTHYGINSATLDDHFTVSVAMPIDYHLDFLVSFRNALWTMIASGIVFMSIMSWIAVRQGNAPLRNIVAQIHRIHANELNTRLDPNAVPTELADLATSFNQMLARMEQDFKRLSHFSADIAHELRTPVTNLLTQTQVALSQTRSIEEYQEILYSNIEEYERMAQMIGDMLFLAQTENRLVELKVEEINLVTEIENLLEYFEMWAEEKNITLSFQGQAFISGDRVMIRRIITNLLSNAIKYTPAHNQVSINLSSNQNNETTICVENTGTHIPSEHIPNLFDRFYRVDASRQRSNAQSNDSSGLGLAIVKSLVEIHGGKIDVSSENNITRFCAIIPATR